LGKDVHRRRRPRRPAETTVATQEARRDERRNVCAALLCDDVALRDEQRAAILALVDEAGDARTADKRARGRHRRVNGDRLLAMDDLAPVDAKPAILQPEPLIA